MESLLNLVDIIIDNIIKEIPEVSEVFDGFRNYREYAKILISEEWLKFVKN